MLLQHFSNILKHVIDYQMVINVTCEAFEFDITLNVSADITMQYLLNIYISLRYFTPKYIYYTLTTTKYYHKLLNQNITIRNSGNKTSAVNYVCLILCHAI